MDKLELALNKFYAKSTPKLPENAKKVIVEWLPWLNLVLGLLSLFAIASLWRWAHAANNIIDYANSLSEAYGVEVNASNRLSFAVWLGLIILVLEAVLYIAAFPGARASKKSGWNLLYWAVLINVLYALAVVFTDYGGFENLLITLLGSAVGLYFLFQIRSAYK